MAMHEMTEQKQFLHFYTNKFQSQPQFKPYKILRCVCLAYLHLY